MIKFWNLKTFLMFVLLLIFAVSCTLPSADGNGQQKGSAFIDDNSILKDTVNLVLLSNQYKYGVKTATKTTDKDAAYLIGEYKKWKDLYFKQFYENGGYIQRDEKSNYDTVSEGQAYGMLLSMYFGDRSIFDRLYGIASGHFGPEGLMHWRQKVYAGNGFSEMKDISEFTIPIPHGAPYASKSDLLSEPSKFDGHNYIETPPNKTDYFQVSTYDRGMSSATDADLDMAGSLVFAWYRWKDPSYQQNAAKMIRNIITSDVLKTGFIKAGTLWGDNKCWNPSYFTPAWFRVYIKFINDTKSDSKISEIFKTGAYKSADEYANACQNVINVMYPEMRKIDSANGTSGFFPDWCDTSGSTPIKANGSDRRYYVDKNNGGTGTRYWVAEYKKQSFNSFYDAVRVPWRLAMDYNWFGNQDAQKMCCETGAFYMQKFKGNENQNMVDGYSIGGSAWKWEDRDGFNFTFGGKKPSVTFKVINACSTMVNTSWQDSYGYASSWYEYIKSTKEQTDKTKSDYTGFHYYGNTLRMISLLYLSGYFINYSDGIAK